MAISRTDLECGVYITQTCIIIRMLWHLVHSGMEEYVTESVKQPAATTGGDT